MYGIPSALRKIKKKHAMLAAIERKKQSFAKAFESDLQSAQLPTIDSCWLCGEFGNVQRVEHKDVSKCDCKVHVECMFGWQQMHEKKGNRIRVCPACKCKRAGWQPKTYPPATCGTVIFGGVCNMRLGHLGPHASI